MPKKPATKKTKDILLVLQQGGSSREVYLHTFDTKKQADDYRDECEKASYATSEPVSIPVDLEQHRDKIDEIIQAALSLF